MDNNLAHHGIPGQKWGVRRFQNKDGTLTAAGKRRARGEVGGQADVDSMNDAELKSTVSRLNLEKQYKKLSAEKDGPSQLEQTKKLVDQSNEMVRQTRKMMPESKPRLDLSNMTDKELREAINRELLERQYSDLFAEPATVRKGQERVNKLLETSGNVLSVASTALAIALTIKGLRKG